MKHWMILLAVACLAGLSALAPFCARGARAQEDDLPGDASSGVVAQVIAVDAPPEVVARVREGDFFSWVLPRRPQISVLLGAEARPEGEPGRIDALISVDLWPLEAGSREWIRNLPLDPTGQALGFDGTTYPAPNLAAAFRLVSEQGEGGGKPHWLITAYRAEIAAEMVDQVLFQLLGRQGRRQREAMDYLLQEGPYLARRGVWLRQGERRVPDPARERDELALRARFFADLVPVPPAGGRGAAGGEGGQELLVRLLAGPGDAGRPGLARLAADLDAAARAMLPRLPMAPEALGRPLSVVVEESYVTQARHTGKVGEAVPGGGTGHDLHLVEDPADGGACRVALARVLLERSGIGRDLPPWLAEGAALWLAGDAPWYGRSYPAWIPYLARARALPTAEDLLAETLPADAPTALWVPVAAAVVDALGRSGEGGRGPAGATLAERLARRPSVAEVRRILVRLAERGEEEADSGTLALASDSSRPVRATFPAEGGLALRGVSLGMLNHLDHGYHAPGVDAVLARLAGLGSDAVSIMPFAYQPSPDRPSLRFLNGSPTSETEIGCLHAARRARARGFRVLWKPHIWVGGGSWPGEIAMGSEADWATWWTSYRRYILHHAVLARWAGAEMFSVGVELTRTQERRREWEELIAAVRVLYPGAVTYAGNWHGGLEEVSFWDQLDFVGVDAYYSLAENPLASEEELAAGAEAVARRLGEAARRLGKPLVLTEVGFAARRGAWLNPHNEGGEVGEEDQAAAYRALFNALRGQPWLRGVFIWKAMSGSFSSPSPRADFLFLDRPAEREVERFFTSPPPDPARAAPASGS